MAKSFGDVITKCPKCGADVGVKHPYTWCSECGEPFPEVVRQQIHSKQNQSPSPQLGGLGSSKPKTVSSWRTVGKLVYFVLLLAIFLIVALDSKSGVAGIAVVGFIVLMIVFQLELNKRNKRGATGGRVSPATARFSHSAPEDPFELHSSVEDDIWRNAPAAVRDLEDTAHATRNQVRPEDTWPLVNPATGDAMVPGTMVDVGGSAFGADIHRHDTGIGAGMPETNPWDH